MDANAPYDSTAFADIILRSSDNVHFYVVGQLLSLVSPIFRDMLALNRGPAAEENESKGSFHIVPLEEHSETLRLLLDSLYPRAEEPKFTSVSLLWKVGKAVKKYFMDVVEGKLKNRLLTSELISKEPLGIYAMATDLEWGVVANEAARRTLNIPLENLAFVDELREITGLEFYRFLEYRIRCKGSRKPRAEQLMAWPPSFPVLEYVPSTPAPFDKRSGTDLILRSADSIDFFVIEAYIRHLSPVFDDMFPLLKHETHDGRPILSIEESSQVLHKLLSIIYHHLDELDMRDCDMYKSVVVSVRKYKMTPIEQRLRRQAAVSPLITKEPFYVFIVLTAVGWDDVAKMAALNMLLQPLSDMTCAKEFDLITGADLYHLVQFRFKCGDAACKSIEADAKFIEFGPSNWNKFWCWDGGRYPPINIEALKEKVKACPRGSTLESVYASAISGLENKTFALQTGGSSQSSVIANIMKCHKRMGDAIEEAVSKVPFAL